MTKKGSTKPEMSRTEQRWHEHAAGLKASETAGKSDSELAMDAIESSTADGREIAGWKIHPPTIGTGIEQAKIDKYFAGLPETDDESDLFERQMRQVAMQQMACADTLRFRDVRNRDGWDALIEEADRLNYEVPAEERKKLADYMLETVAKMNALSGAANQATSDEPDDAPGK